MKSRRMSQRRATSGCTHTKNLRWSLLEVQRAQPWGAWMQNSHSQVRISRSWRKAHQKSSQAETSHRKPKPSQNSTRRAPEHIAQGRKDSSEWQAQQSLEWRIQDCAADVDAAWRRIGWRSQRDVSYDEWWRTPSGYCTSMDETAATTTVNPPADASAPSQSSMPPKQQDGQAMTGNAGASVHQPNRVQTGKPWMTVFNREPHSGSGGSEFPAPFRTRKDQRYFGNDRNRFRKVLVPFRTRNRQKHFNRLTISYVHLNLSLPFVTAPITIHYKLHSGPSGGLIRVYLRPWYIYTFILLTSTSVVFVHLRQRLRWVFLFT